MSQARVLASARVVCYINGLPLGRVSGFRFSSETPRKATYGIDATEPFELTQTTTRVRGSLSLYRTIGDAGAEGTGLVARYEDLLREKYFSITLLDRGTDTIVFQSYYNSVVSQSWDFQAKGLVTGTVEFEGIEWSNEFRPEGPV